jgi:hypothetical protein
MQWNICAWIHLPLSGLLLLNWRVQVHVLLWPDFHICILVRLFMILFNEKDSASFIPFRMALSW